MTLYQLRFLTGVPWRF